MVYGWDIAPVLGARLADLPAVLAHVFVVFEDIFSANRFIRNPVKPASAARTVGVISPLACSVAVYPSSGRKKFMAEGTVSTPRGPRHPTFTSFIILRLVTDFASFFSRRPNPSVFSGCRVAAPEVRFLGATF